jgi:hypothetical protein
MGDSDQGDVRLLAKGNAQAEGAMGGKTPNEKVRQRLAVFRILVLRFRGRHPILVAVLDDLAIFGDSISIAVRLGFRLRFGLLVLGPDCGQAWNRGSDSNLVQFG